MDVEGSDLVVGDFDVDGGDGGAVFVEDEAGGAVVPYSAVLVVVSRVGGLFVDVDEKGADDGRSVHYLAGGECFASSVGDESDVLGEHCLELGEIAVFGGTEECVEEILVFVGVGFEAGFVFFGLGSAAGGKFAASRGGFFEDF